MTFQPAGVTVEVDPALFPYGKHGQPGSVLDIALAHGVEVEHACGGVGVCGTCHVLVTNSADSLSPPTDDELDVIDAIPAHTLHSRLACQAVVAGDVTVTVPAHNHNAV
ncbi:MAG: 2Fe-2S iron-sulfur cluster-binding protein [Phycisphaerae bacterium]|nr:2Fe-2S iron-sulfur cluster-binding protein [Phycisphaerae bacterium]